MFLYTSRQTAPSVGALPYKLNQIEPQELLNRIKRDIDYVVANDQDDWNAEMASRIAADSSHFVPIFRVSTKPAMTVYRVVR